MLLAIRRKVLLLAHTGSRLAVGASGGSGCERQLLRWVAAIAATGRKP